MEMECPLHETGIFPIMHTVVIRADVYSAHPWVAQSLVKAFEVSKDIAMRQLHEATALKVMLPWLLSRGRTDRWKRSAPKTSGATACIPITSRWPRFCDTRTSRV